MKHTHKKSLGLFLLGFLLATSAFAQEEGDYRSAADGDWSNAATWEVFESSAWAAAAAAPNGSEVITVTDSVSVDVAVSISGTLAVADEGYVTEDEGALEIADGGVYEHARDGGRIPTATWASGSTLLITGVTQTAPDNRNQSYHHVIFNTPGLLSNLNMAFNEVTIGGNVTVQNTGSARWYLTSASAQDTARVTILGDVIVEDGQFAVQGTSNAMTGFEVHHHGNLTVTGGNFSLARGSQGSGSGSTIWYLYEGDFMLSDAAMQNSNPTPGQAAIVFAAGGTQQMSVQNVDYAGGDIHFEVADSTTLEIADGFTANGQILNRGEITPLGALTFLEGGVYVHARDGGTVPTATWEEGSTALFAGIVSSAPANRGQDYYHLTLDTPDMSSNLDLSLGGHTIGGNLSVLSSGSSRWRFVGGSDAEITIQGDVVVQNASLETQGTGSATTVVVHHWGDVVVENGNLSVSRGSQGGGTGTTHWFLYEGDFTMTNAESQNSNPTPGSARFVFASGGTQTLTIEEGENISNLSIEVSDSTTLDLGLSEIVGSGIFWAQDGATLATAHPDGLAGNLQTSGDINLGTAPSITFNGTEGQSAGTLFPDTLQTLTIANPDSVVLADTNYVYVLHVADTGRVLIDATGSLTVGAGTVDGTVINAGELIAESPLEFSGSATYEHARDGGSIPDGLWGEGSTVLITGVMSEAPDNRNQGFHHLILNTPNQSSNLNMAFDEVTIGGDIRVVNTGGSRWYLTSASAEDTSVVTIMGDVIVEDGQFAVQGTSNAFTVFEVHHYGNVDVTGGNFSIARGSQSGTGTTTWYLHAGNFSMSGAQTQNSNPGNARFVFAAADTQMLAIDPAMLEDINHLPIEVASGTTLDAGLSEIGGSDLFILNEGATLATAHPGGVAGTIQTSGDVMLSDGASFIFNGDEAQVTSTLMPTVVHNLTIDNEAGVTLSQETTINGTLRLLAGVFDNTIPFTLGPEGEIVYEGGSLLDNVAAEGESEIPAEFALHQNYPNPFNPSTLIRYDIREPVHVTITLYDATGRRLRTLVDGRHAAGKYEVQWNAVDEASGVYYYQIRAGDWTATRSLLLVK